MPINQSCKQSENTAIEQGEQHYSTFKRTESNLLLLVDEEKRKHQIPSFSLIAVNDRNERERGEGRGERERERKARSERDVSWSSDQTRYLTLTNMFASINKKNL